MLKIQIEYDLGEGDGPVTYTGTGVILREAFIDAVYYLPLIPGVSIKITKVEGSR